MAMLAFVHALAVFAAFAAAPLASDPLPVATKGKMAAVVLLHASRVSPEDLKACCPGVANALRLVFLTKPIDDPVDFAISPVVQMLIDRQKYPAEAADGAKRPVPRIEVREVEDLFKLLPDLAGRVPSGFNPHLAVLVTVPCGTLPGSGQVEFALKLGYHRQVEPFSFAFALPAK
jgi:hypothetical protein